MKTSISIILLWLNELFTISFSIQIETEINNLCNSNMPCLNKLTPTGLENFSSNKEICKFLQLNRSKILLLCSN